MRITYNWLKTYTDFVFSPEELIDALTMLGLEVDSVQPLTLDFDGIVVGKVTKKAAHQNADRLSVCEVDIGSKRLNIVCGAPNVAVGQIVPVALQGTQLPNGMLIKETAIRGVESQGMICSEAELGISSRGDGIMVLDEGIEHGKKLRDIIDGSDSVIDIDVSPNRPDCFGIIGIARDVAAIAGTSLTKPSIELSENTQSISELIDIKIHDAEKCPRYSARFISGVKIKPSPWWLAQRLEAVGIRSINNIVDVTNYVMMETGQPLHAFDYELLRGRQIIVKTAHDGEKFTTLDDVSRTLNSECLMICDGEGPVALGGVMGGLNSEVSENTTNLLLESAHFDPVNIRRTSKFLGLSTEASRRFERGVDPNGTLYALERAAQLIAELSGGKVAKGCADVYAKRIEPISISLRKDRVETLLGISVPDREIESILKKLGCEIEHQDDYKVTVPTFRPDLTREADLIEEVARVFGYDKIPADTRAFIEQTVPNNQTEEFIRQTIQTFMTFGFSETITYNLIARKYAEILAAPDKLVNVINPISEDLMTLRPGLLPGLLKTVQWNLNRNNTNLKLFEIGVAFTKTKKGVDEHLHLSGVLCGTSIGSWNIKSKPFDIFDLKGYVSEFLDRTHVEGYQFEPYATNSTSHKSLAITKNSDLLGFLGEVKYDLLEKFEIDRPVFMFDFDLERVRAHAVMERSFVPIPKFPPSKRDLAIVVEEKVKAEDLICEIRENGGEFLKNVKVFDVFKGDSIGGGKKSLAFNLTFYSLERTLTEGEVESKIQQILEALSKKYSAMLRS